MLVVSLPERSVRVLTEAKNDVCQSFDLRSHVYCKVRQW